MFILNSIFGNPNEKFLKKLKLIVEEINKLEKKFEHFSNEKIKQTTKKFKQRIENQESLDDILPEAFAIVREAAKRTLKQRHYDVQLMGGIVLHQGKIAEMKTGEGKTLAATLPLYLNALIGKGVHLITVNDYLARRDTTWMGQIYHFLGLTTGCINHDAAYIYDPAYTQEEQEKELDQKRDELGSFKIFNEYLRPVSRKQAYEADITYGTNNEFGFDYLRDNMTYNLDQMVQKEFNYAIIDEVDNILIDEARTPLIISAPDRESPKLYEKFTQIIPQLKKDKDYEIDEKMGAISLTNQGIDKIENILKIENIYDKEGAKYVHYLEQSLKAKELFKKDKDYVVRDGQVIIVDEFTGRLMPGRRWGDGLHQAVEAKENVEVNQESKTLATITFQNLFRMYKKLAGMTGTAVSSVEEFEDVYKLPVIIVPTNKSLIRKSLPDKIYKSEQGKFRAIVQEIKERYEKKQPVLVGTISIEKNEFLSSLLKKKGIPHQVLNAKHHEKEGAIIAQAGKLCAVTVATNMAGRGVDIILGGNPLDKKEAEKTKKLDGLFVLGTERHEARRIDNQLRGRSGRQGDPGSSQFFVSVEDELMRKFGSDKIKKMMETFRIPEEQPIQNKLISSAIEKAQAKVEGINFDARKHVLEYDDVVNKHRKIIYTMRKEIIIASDKEIKQKAMELVGEKDKENYKQKEQQINIEQIRRFERLIMLNVIDMFWTAHLDNMSHLRQGVGLRAYGQKDPLVEYKNEGHKLFKKLLEDIKFTTGETLLKTQFKESFQEQAPAPTKILSGKSKKEKIGRNDPCPCGSGKKYKKCCWPKFG